MSFSCGSWKAPCGASSLQEQHSPGLGPAQSLEAESSEMSTLGFLDSRQEAHPRNTLVLTGVSPGQTDHWSVVETEDGDRRGPGRGPWAGIQFSQRDELAPGLGPEPS